MLKQIISFKKFQTENSDLMMASKGSFQGRVAEVPFLLDIGHFFLLKNKGMDPNIMANKKLVRKVFTLLQLHPCYVIKIL